MRKHDIRGALLMDHHHGRLYLYRAGHAPRMLFLPANLPPDFQASENPDVDWMERTDRDEAARDFYREAREALKGCTDIVIAGPGNAKEELAHSLRDFAAFRDLPVRTYTTAWIDEPAFETWAREKLAVPSDVMYVYVKAPREGVRRRAGSPGAPVEPERHRRTNEIKPSYENVRDLASD